MKNKKFLSVLLCLALLASLPVLPGGAAAADGSADNGMKISKTATANNDGTYTITLEAFATGEKTTTVQTEDVPTDIILVLDQSGSMKENIGQVQYTAYTGNDTQNKSNYEKRHNGGSANLWHKLPDGSFVSVSVTLQQTITYNKITKGRNDNGSKGYTNYWENRNNLYTYVNGEIKKVVYTRERDWFGENYNCKYALEDGTILNQNNEGSRYSPTFQNTDDGYLYLAVVDENQNVYTYTYTDTTGTVQTIGTSTGPNTRFEPAFYRRSTITSGGGSRLNALKSAANAFANAVAEKAAGADGTIGTSDDVNHRIAVVGYADTDNSYGYNTGVFIGSTLNRYESAAAGVYGTALQDMSTTGGKNNVTASINALQASGATRTDYGLIMAKGILNANPVPEGETRNRVVIVFTDGAPTDFNGFQRNVANSAISTANAIKAGGTTVYSIGIFSGADASTAGKEPDEDYYASGWSQNYTEAEMSAACNWFMQQVSSNNGTPRTPSYYLSAGDAASLNNIFQQISNNITTGGSSTTLGSETVVKDIISPYFTLPAGTAASSIQIDTYACTGKTGDTYTWSSTSSGNGGASATVNGDQVSVTGFNFSENWCGTETDAQGTTTVRGKKLVISFTVDPKDGFLGGNDVITNASAGIYENGSAQTPVMTFEQPTVNVPIKDVTVTAEDKNVYLLGEVTADELKNGATVKVGGVELNLGESNYGLEDWQTAYVTIDVKFTDENGNEIDYADLKDLKADKKYKLTATVSPKTTEPSSTQGEKAETKTATVQKDINVFMPSLKFQDSIVKYRQTVVDDAYYADNNLLGVTWVHGNQTSTQEGVSIIGEKPEITLTYNAIAGALDTTTGLVITAADILVAAIPKIGNVLISEWTIFEHDKCDYPNCSWTQYPPHFLLHVTEIFGDLTIQKNGLNVSVYGGKEDRESAIFKVEQLDGEDKQTWIVAVNGNGAENAVTLTKLPAGRYRVTEMTDWTWRYASSSMKEATNIMSRSIEVTVRGGANSNTLVECTNDNHNDKWLGGDNYAKNEFGSGN